jgi:hypothetical protein
MRTRMALGVLGGWATFIFPETTPESPPSLVPDTPPKTALTSPTPDSPPTAAQGDLAIRVRTVDSHGAKLFAPSVLHVDSDLNVSALGFKFSLFDI